LQGQHASQTASILFIQCGHQPIDRAMFVGQGAMRMTATIGATTAMDRLFFGFHGFCLGTKPNASMLELVDRAGAYHKSEMLFFCHALAVFAVQAFLFAFCLKAFLKFFSALSAYSAVRLFLPVIR